jgi:hypothetical protein
VIIPAKRPNNGMGSYFDRKDPVAGEQTVRRGRWVS